MHRQASSRLGQALVLACRLTSSAYSSSQAPCHCDLLLNVRMHQKIDQPWGLSVHGTGVVRAEPEIAQIAVAVDVVEAEADAAFADASTAVTRVREVIRAHGIPDSAVSSSRLSIKSAYDGYGESRKLLGFRCRVEYAIQTREIEAVQRLVTAIVTAGAEHVDSVTFDVLDKPTMRDQARREAVAAARRKAEVYADAAGVRLGSVVHIQDLNPEMGEVSRGHGGGGGNSTDDLAPGAVEVTAAVLVGYALES